MHPAEALYLNASCGGKDLGRPLQAFEGEENPRITAMNLHWTYVCCDSHRNEMYL